MPERHSPHAASQDMKEIPGEILLVVYAHACVIRRFLGDVIAGAGDKNDAHGRHSNGPYAEYP
jgi:hypothetical protein